MLLELKNLILQKLDKKAFSTKFTITTLLNKIDFAMREKECIALLGTSRSGIDTFLELLSGIYLKNRDYKCSGDFLLNSEDVMHAQNPKQLCQKNIAHVMPVDFFLMRANSSLFEQLSEYMPDKLSKLKRINACIELLAQAGTHNPESFLFKKPAQIKAERYPLILLAFALQCDPKIIILPKSFSKLGQINLNLISKVIKNLNDKKNIAVIQPIDNALHIDPNADRVYVFNDGETIESGLRSEIFKNPKHEISQRYSQHIA